MLSKPQGVPSGQYFKHPLVNMKLLLIALSVGCIASPAAKAQLLHLIELQRPPSCIEKDDGYSAGMQEKFPIKSKQGEEQAGCATVPAGYLSTAGHDGHDGRGGIVEMLGSSFRMGGSRVTPSAVILVQ